MVESRISGSTGLPASLERSESQGRKTPMCHVVGDLQMQNVMGVPCGVVSDDVGLLSLDDTGIEGKFEVRMDCS